MRHSGYILALIILATLACSLSSKTDSGANTGFIPSSTPFVHIVTPTPGSATNTLTPTATSTRPTAGNTGSGNTVPCTVQTGWPVYVVQQGDTLGQIAQRTGSTISALATANCLSNPNALSVSQQLRVPRLPTVPTATPTQSSTVPTIGFVTISHYLGGDGGSYILEPGRIVTLAWPEAPRTASTVYFVAGPVSGPGGGGDLGIDTNLADGAAITWQVPPHLSHNLSAIALRADGSAIQKSYTVGIYSGNAMPPNECMIRNDAGMPQNIYSQPSLQASVFGQLMPFDFVAVVSRSTENWIAIFPAVAQAGSFGIYRIKWIQDTDLTSLYGPCASIPTLPINVSATGCFMMATPGATVNLYSQPNIYETPFGTLTGDLTVEVMLQTSDGWYGIEPGIAQAGNVGAYRLKWLPVSSSITLAGTCNVVPLLTVTWN